MTSSSRGREHVVLHARSGGEQVEIELPLETLLDDLHVQQAEESDAEPEPERMTALGLVDESGIVELQRSSASRRSGY
jgi:hypothetical protein